MAGTSPMESSSNALCVVMGDEKGNSWVSLCELFGIMPSSLEERHRRTCILGGIGSEMALERFRIIQPLLEHDRSLSLIVTISNLYRLPLAAPRRTVRPV